LARQICFDPYFEAPYCDIIGLFCFIDRAAGSDPEVQFERALVRFREHIRLSPRSCLSVLKIHYRSDMSPDIE